MKAQAQPDLFGHRGQPTALRYPDSPGHRGVATQIAAAKAIAPYAPTQAQLVLDHVRSCGAYGATRPEIAAAIGISLQSACGRARELVLEGRLIEPDGYTRGKPAKSVLVAA